jgi:poly-gamma-glutamate capsule biosynthesis protein CapA/YwtB (metallophosphatase superfamily)
VVGKDISVPDLNITLVGDINVSRPDPDSAFSPALPWLSGADILFCNLETVVADARFLPPYARDWFRTDEWMFESYVKAGFNVVNQANNPNTYHGHDALLRSLEVLDSAGVVHGGSGRNLADARKPAIIERKGTKVAFVCRTSVGLPELAATTDTPGVARYPVHTIYEAPEGVHSRPGLPPIVHTIPDAGAHRLALQEDIRTAREQADMVIVSWHWGLSPDQIHPHAGPGDVEVMQYQREMAHFAIDVGADMVVGHHSHQPQPIEVYKGRPIFYSLANFVHDLTGFGQHNLMTLMVRCVVRDGRIDRLSFVPGWVQNGPPNFSRPNEAPEVVRRMIEMSASFGTQFQVGDEDVSILLDPQAEANAR